MHLEAQRNQLLQEIIELLKELIAAILRLDDITSLGGKISQPVSQEKQMAIKALGAATSLSQNMFDDQQATYTPAPTNSVGVAEAFPTGTAPVYTAAPGTAVKITPLTDGSGGLLVQGVPTVAGVEVITGVYTNADASTATVTMTFTQSIDPAEADIATLGGTISTPVAQ